jgi:hypothetical protein
MDWPFWADKSVSWCSQPLSWTQRHPTPGTTPQITQLQLHAARGGLCLAFAEKADR